MELLLLKIDWKEEAFTTAVVDSYWTKHHRIIETPMIDSEEHYKWTVTDQFLLRDFHVRVHKNFRICAKNCGWRWIIQEKDHWSGKKESQVVLGEATGCLGNAEVRHKRKVGFKRHNRFVDRRIKKIVVRVVEISRRLEYLYVLVVLRYRLFSERTFSSAGPTYVKYRFQVMYSGDYIR